MDDATDGLQVAIVPDIDTRDDDLNEGHHQREGVQDDDDHDGPELLADHDRVARAAE